MTIRSVAQNFISQLGNNSSSIAPLATKDLIKNQAAVYTYYKNGGKHDAGERFLEENGTSVIWLAGIPVIKKLLDKTIYKKADINPDIDIRKLKQGAADSIEFSLSKLNEQVNNLVKQGKEVPEYLTSQIKSLSKAGSKGKLTKGLFLAKFGISTALTLAALGGLIIYKQKKTENSIKNEIRTKYEQRAAFINNVKSNDVYKIFNDSKNKENEKKAKGVNFTGSPAKLLSNFMYNPLWNQSILDVGILGIRTGGAREGERGENLFKELFEIACLYPVASMLQKSFEFIGEKVFKKPIQLGFDVLTSDTLKESLKDKKLKGALEAFTQNTKTDKELLNYIYDNSQDTVVKLLKESGDVKTLKQTVKKRFGFIPVKKATDNINSLAYIDSKNVRGTIEKLRKLALNTESLDASKVLKNLNTTKTIKAAAILLNIGIGIWLTGVLQPLLIIMKRKMTTGENENPAIKKIETEMQNKFSFQGSSKL